MTVTYTAQVSTEKLGGFFRLLFRWRGSIYSVVYGEMSIFVVLYALLSLLYRHVLGADQKKVFEKLCLYFNQFSDYVPITFVLGFYVVRAVARRWAQWEAMPWPDRFALDVSVYVAGEDLKSRMLRRSLVRYANLGAVLCFRDISAPVKLRFPTLQHLVGAGLMTDQEVEMYVSAGNPRFSSWWVPFQWCYTLIHRLGKEGRISENVTKMQDGVHDLRQKCWVLFGHDWIQIPMVYTQVATLSVYMFMLGSLFGRQYLDDQEAAKVPSERKIDLYVPFFTILQLTFYLGWLKVAEVLISPMGLDADDFDVNYIIDRNMSISYSIVDANYNRVPPIEQDVHWNCGGDTPIPHTLQSLGVKDQPFKGSAVDSGQEPPAEQLVQLVDVPNGGALGLRTASHASLAPPPRPLLTTQRMVSRTGSTLLRSLVSVMARHRSHDSSGETGDPVVLSRRNSVPHHPHADADAADDSATPLLPVPTSRGASQAHLLLASIAESPQADDERDADRSAQPEDPDDQPILMRPAPRAPDDDSSRAKDLS